MNYWLMKSEPDVFSIEDLAKRKNQTEPWSGVRNYQARNYMKEMRKGDLAFFYHSSCKVPGIAGLVTIDKIAYPDDSSWDKKSEYFDPKSSPQKPLWWMVDVKLHTIYPHIITIDMLKKEQELKEMITLRKGNRLSITPVQDFEYKKILKLA
jgi:predicted RNA-binding protein with PUA-like domain